ncbi:hypothetical protein G7B40_041285 [Aetokthonos hydrillicola Thurmond2011]|jgi:hypothetical protein|uniref:Uncharacterized protein n=1 Tax=Aetokthonos hydrillicola Thurmond2011 TaxID=2712845 RepID=A0AAP5MA85_9CYAN|nr:hypothetical protein [Aetokthonos hydrillicola]MBO3461863.1 hypothetical protein [Aetokthonos hydrillicola CCALA 1050]MBW4588895.1 hypothetical protein [Aetokthonos hydrillicola CCALA 1050]MDR9900921.1 hypothetical protein [Aetokthonos hydrillicola Thurmond2011]
MTPTLFGRWQTRLLLLLTVGVAVSIPFATGLIASSPGIVYFEILAYVAIFGLAWDIVYNQLQKYRWDRDWPAIYQLFAGIWEMVFVWLGVGVFHLLPVPQEVPIKVFLVHYSIVWIAVFIASQSVMRILFPHWRFRGGRWL